MKLIAAVDKNWGIGRNNRLLVNIPEDMQLFRQETNGKVVIMGRKTFESLPRLLPGRTHFVLSRRKDYQVPEGVRLFHDVETLMENLPEGENFVIGGEHIYSLLLSKADKVYMTRVGKAYDGDAFFPPFEEKEWIKEKEFPGEGDIPHTFVIYRRK